ncbi:MAG: hypothetical protein H0Z32_15390 [Bacillaceae bacterium]|nr:hypothetical protein [Bacillaceae bacterium]
MEDIFRRLTKELQLLNEQLSELEARTWVELLWEDFETTRARAGREYKGKEMTEQIVRQWVHNYGPRLHEMSYEKFLKKNDNQIH